MSGRRALSTKGLLTTGGLIAAGGLAVVGAEAFVAVKRDYQFDEPSSPPASHYGSPDSPILRFAIVGDSTAVGVGVSSAKQTYPQLLSEALGAHYRVELGVFARTGARMSDAAATLAVQAISHKPEIVLVGLGGNDAAHVTNLREVRRSTGKVLSTLERVGAKTIVVLGPKMDPPAIPQPLRSILVRRGLAVNQAIGSVCAYMGVRNVDLSKEFGGGAARPGYYSRDGYHPGALGYAMWAKTLTEPLLALARRVMT